MKKIFKETYQFLKISFFPKHQNSIHVNDLAHVSIEKKTTNCFKREILLIKPLIDIIYYPHLKKKKMIIIISF